MALVYRPDHPSADVNGMVDKDALHYREVGVYPRYDVGKGPNPNFHDGGGALRRLQPAADEKKR